MKTLVQCMECENTLEINPYEEPLCEWCYHSKDCQAPASIEFYSAHFGGHGVAKCADCAFLSVSWECACDLIHDCAN